MPRKPNYTLHAPPLYIRIYTRILLRTINLLSSALFLFARMYTCSTRTRMCNDSVEFFLFFPVRACVCIYCERTEAAAAMTRSRIYVYIPGGRSCIVNERARIIRSKKKIRRAFTPRLRRGASPLVMPQFLFRARKK